MCIKQGDWMENYLIVLICMYLIANNFQLLFVYLGIVSFRISTFALYKQLGCQLSQCVIVL